VVAGVGWAGRLGAVGGRNEGRAVVAGVRRCGVRVTGRGRGLAGRRPDGTGGTARGGLSGRGHGRPSAVLVSAETVAGAAERWNGSPWRDGRYGAVEAPRKQASPGRNKAAATKCETEADRTETTVGTSKIGTALSSPIPGQSSTNRHEAQSRPGRPLTVSNGPPRVQKTPSTEPDRPQAKPSAEPYGPKPDRDRTGTARNQQDAGPNRPVPERGGAGVG